jgi:iron complex outermembrane receptor protein
MLFSSDSLGFETTVGRAIGKHRLTVGGGVEHSPSIKLENFLGGGSAGLKNEISASRFGSFGEIELDPVSKLKIHLGGRVDWFDSFGATASPRVAVIYSPNEKTALKYIFGRAFRAPNSYENYYSDGIQVEPHAQPLRPERFQSHEVILERTLSKWVRFTADAYYNDLRQLIDQVPDPATRLTYFVNSGSDRARGLEFEVEGKRASGFAFRASYSLSEATDLLRQRRLENSPLHQVKLNSTLPLGARAFLGMEAITVSAQRTYQQTRVPPFVIQTLRCPRGRCGVDGSSLPVVTTLLIGSGGLRWDRRLDWPPFNRTAAPLA